MRPRPAREGRAWRCALVALLVAATGFVDEQRIVAAAPAELISVSTTGGPLGSEDTLPSVSGDGNIVVFTGLAPSGAEFWYDWVYVRDRAAGTTTNVPKPFLVYATDGGVLSRDGCHVAFWGHRQAFNLIFFIIPEQWDIYTWDRCLLNAQPILVSTTSDFPLLTGDFDIRGPLAISADGRYVAYTAQQFYVGPLIARIDTSVPEETRMENGFFFSTNSIDISDDGGFIGIGGRATIAAITRDVVRGWTPPCDTGGEVERDSGVVGLIRAACTTELISIGSDGDVASGLNRSPSLSADGRYVAFVSTSPDIVGLAGTTRQVYVRDRLTGVTKLVTTTPLTRMAGDLDNPEISPDGTQIALEQAEVRSASTKPVSQVFVARSASGYFDTAEFDLVSFGVSGAPTSSESVAPSMSSNGRYVAFASDANIELSGVSMPDGLEVWMRERPIALDITPSNDFGTIDVGGQSGPRDAVVRNTSSIAINITAVTPPAAPFSIIANGCGGALQPGASCLVTMVFRPTAGGGASSSLTVSGDGLSVASSLVGVGRTPNIPTPGSLTITPPSADYGSAAVGSSIGAKPFVVSNIGETAVTFSAIGFSGAGADQFGITSNGCGTSLGGGLSCTVDVAASLTREGAMSATLGVLGTGGQSAQATLRVTGTVEPTPDLFAPVLKMNPGVVRPGQVTVAIGTGFPSDIDVQLAFANEPPLATVHTSDTGEFRFDLLVLRNGVRVGGREVIALDQPQFTGVRAPLLIDLATFRPSGLVNPAITNGVRSLISRSG